MTLGSPERSSKGIMDIFENASEKQEIIEEVVAKAWAIMIQDKRWKTRFDNEKAAITALQTLLLK